MHAREQLYITRLHVCISEVPRHLVAAQHCAGPARCSSHNIAAPYIQIDLAMFFDKRGLIRTAEQIRSGEYKLPLVKRWVGFSLCMCNTAMVNSWHTSQCPMLCHWHAARLDGCCQPQHTTAALQLRVVTTSRLLLAGHQSTSAAQSYAAQWLPAQSTSYGNSMVNACVDAL